MSKLCSDERLSALITAMQSASLGQDASVANLLCEFPDDARLHFIQASILVGNGQLIEAHSAFVRALALEPDFAIARFQFGFFQLTSGEAANALDTWGRLDGLPDGHYLRLFVNGLRCLIRDDFIGTSANLKAGILANIENPPLNNDMELILNQCHGLLDGGDEVADSEAVSETALILKQFSQRSKLH